MRELLLLFLFWVMLPLAFPSSLESEFVLFDPRLASDPRDDHLSRLRLDRLRYLSFNPCDLNGNVLPCLRGNLAMGLEFSLSSGSEEELFNFRFYRKPGIPLGVEEEDWYDVDARRWAHMSYDDRFYSTLQNGSMALMEEGGGEYTALRWGRWRLREWNLLENCNGIHSFALELHIDQDFQTEDALPISAPIFGWVKYNTNRTLDHSAAFAKWQQDQSRFSMATLQEAGSFQKEIFPRTQNHQSSWECNDDNQVQELFVWLDGDHRAEFRGPRPFYPEGTPYSEQVRGSFQTNVMYHAMGRNRRPQPIDYNEMTVEAWAYMEVVGPYGRGPLNTGYWCNGFEGRFVLHELNVYQCRFGVAANLALDFEQHCLDENDQPTNDPPVWGSIRVNSTVPVTEDLNAIFGGSSSGANVFQQQAEQSKLAAVHAKQVAVGTPNAESVVLEADGTQRDVPSATFQGELLSVEKNTTIRLDGLELLAFVKKRMCPRNGNLGPHPCNNGKASGISFYLYKEEQQSNVTATGRTSKRQKYEVVLYAPPEQDSFQEGVWYEGVTALGLDSCQNAHSSINVGLYELGATVKPEDQHLVNQGRLIFHELTVPHDCSGIQSLALDLQLHLYQRTSPPVFVFLRYNSKVPIDPTRILQRHESLDGRDSAVFESTASEGWWEDGSSLLDASTESSAVSTSKSDATTRTVSFGYLESQSIIGGCNQQGIGGFSIQMQPQFGSGKEGWVHFAAPLANDTSWQPLRTHTWYAGSDDYEVPAGFGRLSLYGYDCDRRVGVFQVHQLELRDCCAVLGSFALDLAIQCVEPSVKDPIYGWIRINTTVPVDKDFIKTLSIQERIDSIVGAPQPQADPTIATFEDDSTTLEAEAPRAVTSAYPSTSSPGPITPSPTVLTSTLAMPVVSTSMPSVPPSGGASLFSVNSWSAAVLACLQMVLLAA